MKTSFFKYLSRLIKAEIKKAFRSRYFKKLLLSFLAAFALGTGFVFYLRWTPQGSRLVSGFIEKNPKTAYNLKKFLKIYDFPYFVYYFFPSSLPKYELTISNKNLKKLNENLPEKGLLTQEHKKTVKASLVYQDKEYSVSVRYRGDKQEHWLFDKKSWRINVKNDYVNGMKKFNFIIPEDRGYLTEALSFHIAQKMGLFTLKNDYIELYINGHYEGVYFLVEHWGKEAIEKNKLESDTNLYGEADFESFPQNIYSSIDNFQKYTSRSDLPKEDKSDLKTLLDYLNNLDDDFFYQKIDEILDLENFLTWQAHSVLFFSHTSDYRHNANLILNREKGKLQFIPWDLGAKDPATHEMTIDYNPLVKRILKNPYYLCQRNKILLGYLNNEENLKDNLDYLDHLYQKTKISFYKDRKKNFLNLDFDYRVKNIKTWPSKAHKKIKKEIEKNDKICQEAEEPKNPSLEDFAKTNPIFKRLNKNEFILPKGAYFIRRNIIVPDKAKITIKPGAKLYFDKEISLISYGKILAQGQQSNKILFSSISANNPWGVLGLIGKEASGSICSNIILENASEARINGIIFTGGLAAHYADIEIKDSLFRNNNGDDAINVKHAKATVKNCSFTNNKFDAIDYDNTTGEIRGNVIQDSGNDGIDLGSASPLITENIVKNCNDKAISIGELSEPEVTNNLFARSRTGIAVKDSAQPKISQNYIQNNITGLISFQKKPFFPRKKFSFSKNWFYNNQVNWELKDGVAEPKGNFVDQKPQKEAPPF